MTICSSCQLGKHSRLPFNSSFTYSYKPFDILHTDLWTSPIVSLNGFKYYLIIVDEFTNFVWTYPLKFKSQVFTHALLFHKFVQTRFQLNIKPIQCYMGGEFDNNAFSQFCQQQGMVFRLSCPDTSLQNGKVEHHIRTINNTMCTLLIHASLPPPYWVYALATSTYLHNILWKLQNSTPTSILYLQEPSYDHLRIFGYLCFPNLSATTTHKLSPRSTPCLFLGYPKNHRGYICMELSTNNIILYRHVVFDEAYFSVSK